MKKASQCARAVATGVVTDKATGRAGLIVTVSSMIWARENDVSVEDGDDGASHRTTYHVRRRNGHWVVQDMALQRAHRVLGKTLGQHHAATGTAERPRLSR